MSAPTLQEVAEALVRGQTVHPGHIRRLAQDFLEFQHRPAPTPMFCAMCREYLDELAAKSEPVTFDANDADTDARWFMVVDGVHAPLDDDKHPTGVI